jgi:hypothetical protein
MSQGKRVKKLETSLTPKQRILLWLEEALKFESLRAGIESYSKGGHKIIQRSLRQKQEK